MNQRRGEQMPAIEILDQIPLPLEGKGEDRFVLEPGRCVAVLDGVTSHSEERVPFEGGLYTYGQFAAEVGKRALVSAADISCADDVFPYRVAEHLAAELAREIAALRAAHACTFHEEPSFVCAAYFPARRMLLRIGDCSVLKDGIEVAAMPNRGLIVEERKMKLRERLARMYQTDHPELSETDAKRMAQAATRPWQWKHRNRDAGASRYFGYGVVNGEHIPERLVEHAIVGPGEIVLSTDGVPRDALRGTWSETERAIAQMDMALVKPDDVTYLRIRVG